jgi:putative Mg2+ transporter-C (MgtC) family protein
MDTDAFPGALDAETMALRLGLAMLCGLALGLDREVRGKAAGLRTHALIALGAAVVTVSGLLMFRDVERAGGQADPLRVVQGIFQALGFIGAGLVFVARADARNLTTAASIVLAAGIGIAAGAGQVLLAAMATGFGLALLTVMDLLARLVSGRPPTE